MTNTQRYLNSIKGFRKDLQEVNDKFRPEYERLERFKDSGSYAQSKNCWTTGGTRRSRSCAGSTQTGSNLRLTRWKRRT